MCNERERLIGYVYDEVDAAERAVIDRHLESCAECRDEIRGLRGVREDLLAWDVPEHGSVWEPFAPARLRPWWRDVPAWALAAAATIMFLIGAAGGVTTRAFMDQPAAVAAQATAPAAVPAQVMPAAVSSADLETVRHEIADLRSEVDQRVRLVSTHTPTVPAVSDREWEQVRSMLKSGDQRDQQVFDLARSVNADVATVKRDYEGRINSLKLRLDRLESAVAVMAQQQLGGKQ
ncbi:MAG TPA: zf-HC2 domain-containing protein [Vicinamibacterales bacterium]|nr:zf-HC2 domain-containing protein [Vicinamibacterales bacterium]